MPEFNVQAVIDILTDLTSASFDAEQVDEAIDSLECIKNGLEEAEEEAADKIDEIQDYLEYLLICRETSSTEIQEEMYRIMDDLQQNFRY